MDEIRNVNYIPNNDDILQSRRRTSDIQKLEFQVKLPIKSDPNIKQTFCMFDVGGQRGERRKWIQVFDGVSAVMFLIDSSSFDAIDDENGRNKLRETINLFFDVWTTRFLLNSNFVLLFNKQDILRKKIERGHRIEDHFPEYEQYKCQPQDRALLSRAGEKLNLFRSSSSRSSRATSSRSTISVPSGTISAPSSTREKRKSLSLYRLRGSYGAERTKPRPSITPSQADNMTPAATTATAAGSQRSDIAAPQHSADTPSSPVLPKSGAEPHSSGSPPSSPPLSTREQNKNTEQAYIKARSFIRDKFLQITREVDHDQTRKFSAQNLMYNSKGCVDQPKRNVCYHYTTATDTENIRNLFENLQKMVIKSTMKDML